MPVVTHLKPQKNNKRVNVYLDDKFAFGIDLDNLVKFGIKVEKSFTQEEIEKIIFEAEFQKTLDKLLHFAMTRPRSAYEVRQWFRRKEVGSTMHPQLIEKLQKLDLLDDVEFAQWWIKQRVEFKKKGTLALTQELAQKGISKDIVNQVLSKFPIDEQKMAQELVKRYGYKWTKYDKGKKRQKTAEFLLRRGFSWEVVKAALKE